MTELIRVIPQNLNAFCPEILIDGLCGLWCDLKWSKEGHQVPERSALCIRPFHFLQPFLCDSPDHKQLVRMIFKNVQCIQAEAVYNCFGCSRADPLDESGGQIV